MNGALPRLSTALGYARRGWPVFPCVPNEKRPDGALAPHGLHDATCDPDTLTAWWHAQPTANIGIDCGRAGVFVVDVDAQHGGLTAWGALTATHGEPQTATVLTPSGGRHYYFSAPEGLEIRNSTSKIAGGIDVKASGGYVLAAGSTLPHGAYQWGGSSVVSTAPAWVLELVTETPKAAPDRSTPKGDRVGEGRRNDFLAHRAGQLRQHGFSTDAIFAALSHENLERCDPALDGPEVRRIAESIGRYAPVDGAAQPASLVALTLEALSQHTFPERKVLLARGETPILRAGHLAEVYAERGSGKTWFVQTIGLVAASGTEAIGFDAPEPCRVLLVDGEMAGEENRDRLALLCERLNIPHTARLTIVAADWQDGFLPRLDTLAGQTAIEPFVSAADLIILDNRSCLFDPEGEKDPSAWQPAQDWLLSLRRRGKAVLLAHHSNRQGGARGHSKPEDAMNLLIKLTKPEDYSQEQGARFLVTFDKSRGAYGSAVAPFEAHLTADGWRTKRAETLQHTAGDKLCDYLRLAHEAGDRPKSASAAITGARVNRNAGFEAWAELLKAGVIAKHSEGGFYVP